MRSFVSILLVMGLLFALTAGTHAAPGIKITSATPYSQSSGTVRGKVTGVTPALYKVAVYIKVGDSWWTKPTFNDPLTDINTSGGWITDIDTGGYDAFATEIKALLVPTGVDQGTIQCGPCCDTPGFAEAVAAATIKRPKAPGARTIKFADRKWSVKRTDFPYDPGPNYFSDSTKNVWVDKQGLHLAVRQQNGVWSTSEVVLSESLGHGTYIFQTNSRVDLLNEQVVLGLFTYDITDCQNSRELDIELARWGDLRDPTDAQYVVQPCGACPACGENCTRFKVGLTAKDKRLTHFLVWTTDKVEFRTYKGHWDAPFPSAEYLVNSWVYANPGGVPEPGRERVRFNMWLLGGQAPSNGKTATAVISNFTWLPPPSPSPEISIDGYSPIGSTDGWAWGSVTNADPNAYEAEVYIRVSTGWWTKPTWASPFTPINSDGTWKTDIVTGGHDQDATDITVFLVPKGSPASLASGEWQLPAGLNAIAVSSATVTR